MSRFGGTISIQGILPFLPLTSAHYNYFCSSLISEIQFHRPDLLRENALRSNVIPLNCPLLCELNNNIQFSLTSSHFLKVIGIPGVGELMLASFTNYFPTPISEDEKWYLYILNSYKLFIYLIISIFTVHEQVAGRKVRRAGGVLS